MTTRSAGEWKALTSRVAFVSAGVTGAVETVFGRRDGDATSSV
jgi:hypothetical protein